MRKFTAQGRNTGFTCLNCGEVVPPLTGTGCRNHCPRCLHSLHVDVNPGDRAADCGGLLVPIGVENSARKGWVVVSRCSKCGQVRRNKAALDDAAYPDDYGLITELSTRPISGQ